MDTANSQIQDLERQIGQFGARIPGKWFRKLDGEAIVRHHNRYASHAASKRKLIDGIHEVKGVKRLRSMNAEAGKGRNHQNRERNPHYQKNRSYQKP